MFRGINILSRVVANEHSISSAIIACDRLLCIRWSNNDTVMKIPRICNSISVTIAA